VSEQSPAASERSPTASAPLVPPSTGSTPLPANPAPPTVAPAPGVEALAAASESIVFARVLEVHPRGDPRSATAHKDVVLQVKTVLRGKPVGSRVVVSIPGDDAPGGPAKGASSLAERDEVLVFLSRAPDGTFGLTAGPAAGLSRVEKSPDLRLTLRGGAADGLSLGELSRRIGGPMKPQGQGESGIEGEAVIGPTRPSFRIGDPTPNTAPYKVTLVILSATDKHEVARVETGEDGRFRLAVPPGDYVVSPLPPGARFAPRAEEQAVTVSAGKFAHVTMSFDNGMR